MTARVWNVDNISSSADSIPGLVASDHVVILEGHKHSVSTVGWCPDHPHGSNQVIATSVQSVNSLTHLMNSTVPVDHRLTEQRGCGTR